MAEARNVRLLIDGEWRDGESQFPVVDKYTGETVARVQKAGRGDVADAVADAKRAFAAGVIEPYRRYEILSAAAAGFRAREAELTEIICQETGFTVKDAAMEIGRAAQTLIISAEEAKRIAGEMVPIDGAPGQASRMAFTVRVPVGVVVAITPFNSPCNTVLHKVAPTLAAGNTLVLKPAHYCPSTTVVMAEIFKEAGLPDGHFNLVHGDEDVGTWLLEEEDVRFYTFTGSTKVGRFIKEHTGLRRVQLELGNISATIVAADADLDAAVPKIVRVSFRKAGQVCTSVQRLYVERPIIDAFLAKLTAATKAAKVGDPRDPDTLVGPMIDIAEAERAEAWLAEAKEQGVTVVHGGSREGAVFQPTILLDSRPDMRVLCEEIFAPFINVLPYDDLDTVIDLVNDTPYGLAAGLFTSNLNTAFHAAKRVDCGTVHINETSSSRVDLMPYGGMKASGFGREGPRYAIQELTEEKLITWNLE